ncbi:MAG: hypothetical protein ACREMM_09320 [Gemmatimonadales bacterium]
MTAPRSSPDPDVLARLTAALAGRYRLDRRLGTGGMAMVYAEEIQLRVVVVRA